jgi:hypothetical protein
MNRLYPESSNKNQKPKTCPVKKPPLLAITSTLLLAAPAAATLSAQNALVEWPLNGNKWTPAILDTSLVKSATGSLIKGGFKTGSAQTDFYIASNDDSLTNSYANATSGANVRLQVRVQDNVTLDPGTLTFDITLQNISGGSYVAYTAGYALYVNDGVGTYAVKTSGGQDFASISIGGSGTNTVRNTASFDLSSVAALATSPTSGGRLFRFDLYIFTDGTYPGLNDKQVIRIDNIALNSPAPVPVPEPSAAALFLAAGVASLAVAGAGIRRIRRQDA